MNESMFFSRGLITLKGCRSSINGFFKNLNLKENEMFIRKSAQIVCLGIMVLLTASVFAGDAYYRMRLTDLEYSFGKLPSETKRDSDIWRLGRLRNTVGDLMLPYAVTSDGCEIILTGANNNNSWRWNPMRSISDNIATTTVQIRVEEGKEIGGKLYIPKSDWSGMMGLDFKLAESSAIHESTSKQFLLAKERYYKTMLDAGIPGAAWFRHQLDTAKDERTGIANGGGATQTNTRNQRDRQSELQRTYSLFTGGRALSENIQLDRQLRVMSQADRTIDIAGIKGITTAEIDWKPIVKDLTPAKDALASAIPADQHVIIFPSFEAMTKLIDEAKANGTPILRILEPRAEDAHTHQRYEKQLCLPLDTWARMLGSRLVKTIAFTGSDPYMRTGTDLAVIFESSNPTALTSSIIVQQSTSVTERNVKPISGMIDDINWQGVASPDRTTSSYMASIDKTVIVSNSLIQLQRVVDTIKGKTPSLASLDEYTFFRDRYKLGDPDETALLMLTDATIRRWCNATWRIANSRRTYAAAVLSELQARYLADLATGKVTPGPLEIEGLDKSLGQISISEKGVSSSVYGSLNFLIPISELKIDKITAPEKEAYERFRDMYQRRWRQFFDPIAIRFTLKDKTIAADITVRPLIAQSEYRQLMDFTGEAVLPPYAGNPHPDSRFHFAMVLDPNSPIFTQYGNLVAQMAPGIGVNPLSWIGQWVSIYSDEDPYWDKLQKALKEGGTRAINKFLEKNLSEIPVAVLVDVKNNFKLSAFLVTLRAFIEQTAPGMTAWETLEHNGQPFVKIGPSEQFKQNNGDDEFANFAVYYAATPGQIVLTLNENLLKRHLDRLGVAAKAIADGKPAEPAGEKWLGASLNVMAKTGVLSTLRALYSDNLDKRFQLRSWSNIPVLNQWHMLYASADPVGFHEKFWQTELTCPGGGKYVWNEELQTMESTVYGCPAKPKKFSLFNDNFFGIKEFNTGLTFEDDGLRVGVKIAK